MSFMLRSTEASTKKKGGFVKLMVYIAGSILAGFFVFSIISTNLQIEESKTKYRELSEQTDIMLEENAAIERYLGDDADMDNYIEEIARDKLDYANPDERVYYIVPSSE